MLRPPRLRSHVSLLQAKQSLFSSRCLIYSSSWFCKLSALYSTERDLRKLISARSGRARFNLIGAGRNRAQPRRLFNLVGPAQAEYESGCGPVSSASTNNNQTQGTSAEQEDYMAAVNPHPRVGVAAIIYNQNGQVVAGKRAGSHGAGTWQVPGGHLEFGESFVACAEREALEETGLRVRGLRVVAVTNDVFGDRGGHYITLFVQCEMEDPTAEPKPMEPDKCAAWFWKTWDDMRAINSSSKESGETLFLPLIHLLDQQPDVSLGRFP